MLHIVQTHFANDLHKMVLKYFDRFTITSASQLHFHFVLYAVQIPFKVYIYKMFMTSLKSILYLIYFNNNQYYNIYAMFKTSLNSVLYITYFNIPNTLI